MRIPGDRRRINLLPYMLVLPAVVMVTLVIGYSIANNLWTSFHNGHLSSPKVDDWVGIDHYISIAVDPQLRQVILNSIVISGGTAVLSVLLGFAWGLVLNNLRRFKAGMQVLVLTPWVLSGVIAARLWGWLLNPVFGLVNSWLVRFVLRPLFHFRGSLELTTRTQTAAMTVIVAGSWRLFPFVFVMILAALQSIPRELYEAAMVDGASGGQRFRHITLPFLGFVLAIVSLLSFVWSFNDFSIIYAMTKGGPGITTMVLPFRVYRFIVDGFRLGDGSALSILMVLFLLVLAFVYVRLLRKQAESGSLM
jgi:multiple sugar transport system permease protein